MDSPKNLTFVSDPVSCEFQGSNILLIPEVGLAHLGNLQLALNYIDFLAGIGLPIIKFQHHFSIFESSPTEPFRVSHDHFPMSRHNYWEYTDFSDSDWKYIYSYAHQKGIAFAITPNSRQSAEYVNRFLKPAFWKVGSSDITNYHLIDFLVDTDIPIIVSTGLANQESLNSLNESYGFSRFIFLSCHSSYPTPLSSFSLERLRFLSASVNSPNVGLSDHTKGIEASKTSLAVGAKIIEKHFTLNKKMYGPDHSSSLNPKELKILVNELKKTEILLGSKIKKSQPCEYLNMRSIRKSIVAKQNIRKYQKIDENMLTAKRPGTGISPMKIKSITNKLSKKNIKKNEIVK